MKESNLWPIAWAVIVTAICVMISVMWVSCHKYGQSYRVTTETTYGAPTPAPAR